MKSINHITITCWVIRPEGDFQDLDQIRALSAAGVLEPVFSAGQQVLFNMIARFDADDLCAVIAAKQYAMRNFRAIIRRDYCGGEMRNCEVYLNGAKPAHLEFSSASDDISINR